MANRQQVKHFTIPRKTGDSRTIIHKIAKVCDKKMRQTRYGTPDRTEDPNRYILGPVWRKMQSKVPGELIDGFYGSAESLLSVVARVH